MADDIAPYIILVLIVGTMFARSVRSRGGAMRSTA